MSRWREQLYIYQGLYPYDIQENSPNLDPNIGPIYSGFYPPWAFFAGLFFFPPVPFAILRCYHAVLNLIALGATAIFAYQIGQPYGKLKTWFVIFACLSFSSYGTTLRTGQYGIIINALLIGMFWLMQQKRSALAGILLGLALTKPTISALFFFIPLIRRRFLAIVTCCAYLAISTLIIWQWLEVTPLYMIATMFGKAEYFVASGYSGINLFLDAGLNSILATILLIILGTGIMLLLAFQFRDYSLLSLFAIATVIGRIWTYHYHYDNVMLLFLVLALLQSTLTRVSRFNTFLVGLVLFSLLLPARMVVPDSVQLTQFVIWILALFYVLWQEWKVIAQKRRTSKRNRSLFTSLR